MRRLDRYLIRSFLLPFLAATAALTGLLLVAEILANLQDFVQHSEGVLPTLATIGAIFLYRAPFLVAFLAPLAMVVGAAFGLCDLHAHNELLAMKACGVGIGRALMPILAAAAAVSVLMVANREHVVPVSETVATRLIQDARGRADRFGGCVGIVEEERSALTEMDGDALAEGGWGLVGSNPAFRTEYSFVRREMRNLAIAIDLPGDRHTLVYAESALPARSGWVLHHVKPDEERVIERAFWRTSLRPQDLAYHRVEIHARPLREVVRLVRSYPAQPRYRVLLYGRLAYPLEGVLLLLLALPLLLGDSRLLRHRLLGVGAATAMCVLFYGVQFLAHHLGGIGLLPPSAAALAPVALGLAGGVFLLDSVRT